MTTSISAKFIAAAALAAAALGGASAAHARSDVYFSIGVQTAPFYEQSPPFYVQPAPVYVQPGPVYVQPRLVYVQPPVYAAPAPVYVRPNAPPYGYVYEDGGGWRRDKWERRHWRQHDRDWNQSRDRDRD